MVITKADMPAGVIEGFYGKTWSWQERNSLLAFLSAYGFDYYIYAPKADHYLRKHWQNNWPEDDFLALKTLSFNAKGQGLKFGLGLSPVSLMEHWNADSKQQLMQRLQQIRQISPDILAILFDDIEGDKAHLAAVQIEVSHFIRAQLPECAIWICPTYYSFDPILPEIFGAMPKDYWQQLGQGLESDIDMLWTGDKVISDNYPAQSLNQISALFKRQPIIWDNSKVSDGRKTSPYLPIDAMLPIKQLQHCKGILINPMNPQPLALINLLTSQLTGEADERLNAALNALCPEIAATLLKHLPLLREVGLDNLSIEEKALLRQAFTQDNPFAQAVLTWLDGQYRFDPACLT